MRMILTVAALVALSCPAVFAADAAAGKTVYDKSCKTCHGADGTPSAGMAKAMNIKDFKTTEFSSRQCGRVREKPQAIATGRAVPALL